MINALNKPSDEKNYADAAAQFAYRAYGFSGDQYNYIVSSIDKQFMEIIKMEMMYQEFIAQRGDYFEEKYPDDESKWESYAAYLIAMLAGVLLGELSKPVLELGRLIRIPDFSNIFHTVSIFAVGFPPISKFISAIPLALICYVLAFGDFVTSQTLVEEAQDSRSDEYIDFNSSRSNLISGLRNLLLAIFAPFPPLAGPLWIGMTVSVAMRYKEGKKAMKSLIGGMSSFRMATFISVILVPIVSFMKPIMGVGSAITLLFQAYVCARIGMDYCKTSTDKSIAGVMAAVLAFKGSGWALLVGFAMNILLSNMEFQKKKLEISETEQN